MQSRIAALLTTAALLSVAPAFAADGTHQFGIEGGTSVPSGTFGDAASTGFNIGGVYQYMMGRYGVGTDVKYHGWSGSDEMNTAAEFIAGPGSEFSFNTWELGVYGVATMPSPTVEPYAKVGFGWYNNGMKLSGPVADETESDSNFGLAVGIGADYKTPSTMTIGLGATYHRLKDSETDFVSVQARVMWPLKSAPSE